MKLNKEKKAYSLSPRDLVVMGQAKVGINEMTRIEPKHPGLPPLWSKIPYLMLLHDCQTTAKYFWKEYREFNTLLETRDSAYRQSRIPKNNGGTRVLLVPSWELNKHQRYILKNILYRIPVSEHACAYHKRRGLTDLAEPHVGHEVLIHFDIEDFFSSITEQMVYECLLEETGYPRNVAGFLSRLCCYKRYLPQGACTSPALSNICFKRCDDEIAGLAKKYSLTYTRYSDDIYLSGDIVPVQTIAEDVKRIVTQYGFRINNKKTKVLHKHQAQKVTAIVVNDKMQVNRGYRRQLRQELYYLNRFGINSKDAQAADGYTEYLYKLHGRVSFVLYVDPENKEFIEAKKRLEKMIDASWSLYPPEWAFY